MSHPKCAQCDRYLFSDEELEHGICEYHIDMLDSKNYNNEYLHGYIFNYTEEGVIL